MTRFGFSDDRILDTFNFLPSPRLVADPASRTMAHGVEHSQRGYSNSVIFSGSRSFIRLEQKDFPRRVSLSIKNEIFADAEMRPIGSSRFGVVISRASLPQAVRNRGMLQIKSSHYLPCRCALPKNSDRYGRPVYSVHGIHLNYQGVVVNHKDAQC